MIDNVSTFAAPTRTAILVAAFDSQLKWAAAIRRGLESKGFACQIIVPSESRHAISASQLADFCGGIVTHLPWTELITASLQVDVVVLAARRKAERVPAATQPPQVSAEPTPGATTSSVTDEWPPRDAARRPSRSRK